MLKYNLPVSFNFSATIFIYRIINRPGSRSQEWGFNPGLASDNLWFLLGFFRYFLYQYGSVFQEIIFEIPEFFVLLVLIGNNLWNPGQVLAPAKFPERTNRGPGQNIVIPAPVPTEFRNSELEKNKNRQKIYYRYLGT